MKSYFTIPIFITALTTFGQTDKELTDQTVDITVAKAHLTFLASDELKGRDTPSEGQRIAAKYIATQFESYGIKAYDEYPDYLQQVKIKNQKKPTGGTISVNGKSFSLGDDFLLTSGANLNWKGEVIILKNGTAEEISKNNVKEKMIVANCGDGEEQSVRAWFSISREKRRAAKEAGAAGFIELYNSSQIPWQRLVGYLNRDRISLDDAERDETPLPSFWLKDLNENASGIFAGAKTSEVKIERAEAEKFTAPNIVGYVEGSDPKLKEEYIVYCAHYDHVGIGPLDADGDSIYNGARDNVIGTVAVMEVAKNLAKYPTKRSALFVLFTAEEKGLLGSSWFVDHSPLEINKMVFCNNIDNGGYNDTSKITVIGLERTTAKDNTVAAVAAYGLEAIPDPAPEQGLFDRSDNVSFASKGVPAPDFSLGFTAFDDEVMKYYHQAADHVETLDMDYVHKYWSAYVLLGRLIGNDPERPYWIMGDKYYEAGEKLYKE
ncbi:MAG: M28 family peptidase [Cytophagales bacterium]|nr:M28 family peptidase [Cytophagales bacterium]